MKNIKIIKDSRENNLKSLNDIQANEKNSSIMNETLSKNLNKANDTSGEFTQDNKKYLKFTKYNEFTGFFFKQFNLTSYKKKCDDSREHSKSPERIYKLNHKKGNGIPMDLVERLKYLSKIVNNEKFQNYYNRIPKGKKMSFESVTNYLIKYYKSHNELEGLLMIYYFICTRIKYYSKETLRKMKEKNKNQTEDNVFLDKKYFEEGYKPKIEEVYSKGIALSPNNFIDIFEYFLKKLEIKYKHIDGYCKLLDQKNDNKKKLIAKNLKYKTMQNYFSKTKSKSTNYLEEITNLPEKITNHSWNAVYVKGEWYFIDIFFGSGGIIKEAPAPEPKIIKTKTKPIYNIFYFLTPPEYFINTHRPNEDYLQFLDKTITFPQFYYKKFNNYGDFYKGVFLYGVELLSHKYPNIEIKRNENLEIKLRQIGYIIEAELFNLDLLNKVGEIKITYEDEEKLYIFEPVFPGLGEYILRVNSRPIVSNEMVYTTLFDYKIKVTVPMNYLYFEKYKLLKNNENNKIKEKRNDSLLLPKLNTSQIIFQPKIIQDYSKILPSKTNKIICYDNQDFHLIEPRTKILRKGIKFKFKIKIKGAVNVSLLDGNHWTPLRRIEEDIYEGNKEIETDNVSICCLRNKNVYTEVMKFMIHKDRSILSKSVFPAVRHIKKNIIKSNTQKKMNILKKIN